MTARVQKDFYFAQIPEWVLFHEQLSPQAIRLYAVLARFADTAGQCFPSRKLLAERLHVSSEKTVDRAMEELKDASAVTVVGRLDDAGDQASNLYVVHTAPPEGVGSRMTPPPDTDDPTGGVKSVPRGGVKSVPLTRATPEPEPNEDSGDSLTLVTTPPGRDDVERICTHLADAVEANGSKRPTVGKRWRDAARLMLDRDERTEDQVHRAIDWCQADEFWRANILSIPKLREQYDRLRLAAQRQRTDTPARGPDWDRMFARAEARQAHQAAEEVPL